MVKVKDLPYRCYTVEEAKEQFALFEKAAKEATCADDVVKAREAYIRPLVSHYNTAASLSENRYNLNTADEFYSAEKEYYNGANPHFSVLLNQYNEMMLSSPFRKELEEKINPLVFLNCEVAKKAHSEQTVVDEQEENAIVTEYSKLMSSLVCEWRGEEVPLSVVRGYLEDADREVRKSAAESIGRGLQRHAKELDDIYDRLVHVRDRMAKKMGYKNFTELGYYRMGRTGYNREMVETFRKNVVSDLVPVIAGMKEEIREKMGWEKVAFYDNDVYGTASTERTISVEEVFQNAQAMYDEMNPEIGEFMRYMQETEAFDVLARKNKWGGGYCTEFPDFKQIFILANFNGSSGDIDVTTHEFGHAFAMNQVYQGGDWELSIGGMETAECHSMSMEFLAWPWMHRFFGDKADAYRYKHLASSLSFIPYGCIVDEFQHVVYDNPDLTPAERKQVYLDLEKKYRPYLATEGIPYLEEGTRWQYQMHIFETPFYYIDYCLAQTVALGFLALSERDYSLALEKYIEFCKTGGQKPFAELVKCAGIAYPFKDGALKEIADAVTKILNKLQ